MASLSEQIINIAAPLAASLGLALWGVEFQPGGRSVLRVFVEDAAYAGTAVPGGLAYPDQTHPAGAERIPTHPDQACSGLTDSGTAEADAGRDDSDILPPQSVTIDQCAHLSRLLGLALDVDDVIPGAYVLEVSSPGLDRTFFSASQLAGALGTAIDLVFMNPPEDHPGRRKFRGVLEKADPETGFALRLEDVTLPGETPELFHFAFADLKRAQQVFVVPEKGRPGKGGGTKSKGRRRQEPDDA